VEIINLTIASCKLLKLTGVHPRILGEIGKFLVIGLNSCQVK
jgi:hypothetical protein